MKTPLLCILIILISFQSLTQSLIHAHNDYQKPEPLTNALRHKVFSIEADIYISGNSLWVAHDKNELITAPTLDSLYLQPIIELFRRYNGTVSEDTSYTPVLMIDIKENGDAAIAQLIKLVSMHRSVFDRSVNAKAVQLVISGDRGASSKWTSYPSYIFFDGRPKEAYDSATLKRVALISDSYFNYAGKQDSNRIEQLAKNIHSMGKLLRLWASPDNSESWKQLQQLGVDVINTDKVEECRNYFLNNKIKNPIANN
jgi:alkaline phosphatase